MLHIGIIGATGHSGTCLVQEALNRNFKVTAFVRDPKKLTIKHNNLDIVILDLTDEEKISELTSNLDVLISAYGPSGSDQSLHPVVAKTLVSTLAKSPKEQRLLVIGGAGSLYLDDNQLVLDSDLFKDEWRETARAQRDALLVYQSSEINWTYFSPSLDYDIEGPRNEKYIIGRNQLLFNEKYESYLSYQTMAVAVIDEINHQKLNKTRVTIISPKLN